MDLPYYKINELLWRWSKEDGARIAHDLSLSTDKAPPAAKIDEAAKRSVPIPPSAKPDHPDKVGNDIEKVASVFSRFKKWLDAPAPPKKIKPVVAPGKPQVHPFDIQEIPAAMRKIHLPMSAVLMERWFAGEINYSRTVDDEVAEINQNGKPFPPDMYDTTIIRLDWVLRFPRAKEKFDYLINNAIRSPKAIEALYATLIPYKSKVTKLDAADICEDDTASLHHHFQFQRASVDGTFGQKINLLLTSGGERRGAPDDLTGALGSFNFYAALGHARFSWNLESRGTEVEVRGVWVYVKDNYTFTDRHGDRSQYLGHWSSDGVIVIPLDAVAATSPYIPYVESSITLGNPVIKGNAYYPVHNSDFRQWSIKHRRGGDFIIFSDRRYVPVVPPIKVYL